jgi:hypothetical protein
LDGSRRRGEARVRFAFFLAIAKGSKRFELLILGCFKPEAETAIHLNWISGGILHRVDGPLLHLIASRVIETGIIRVQWPRFTYLTPSVYRNVHRKIPAQIPGTNSGPDDPLIFSSQLL